MTTIVTRVTGPAAKNAPLTSAELDTNFINLNTDKLETNWTGSSNLATVGTITSGTWNAGAVTASGAITSTSTVQGTRLISTVASGTAPLTVASNTVVTNLNADLLDGQDGTFYSNWTNITNKPSPVITLAGDLTGSVTLTNLASGTLTATIVANSVQLGTDTVGSYVSLISGTTNQINVSGSGVETANVTLSLPQDIHTGASPTFTNLTLTGNLTVNGATTTINSTTLLVDDKNIELGTVDTPTEVTAENGGIILKGTTDKTLVWLGASGSWTSNQNFELTSGKVFRINGAQVLSQTALGSGVVSSSLTSVGTITSGTWNGTTIAVANGGTGRTTLTANAILLGNGTSGVNSVVTGTSGQLLQSSGTNAPVWTTGLTYDSATSTLTTTHFNSTSDASLKINVVTITDAVSTVNKLEGVEFDWKDTGKRSSGVIAQRLEEILPHLVDTNQDGVKSVNYAGLTAYLIQAVKELSTRLEKLENQ